MTTTPTRRERHAASRLLTAIDRVLASTGELRRARDLLADRSATEPSADTSEPYYITRFREIAAADSTLPHVREAITSALAAYDARRAGA